MRCHLLWVLGLAWLLFALPGAAQADGRGTVYTVGVEDTEYLPHYSIIGHEYSGFAREVLDRFAKQNGLRFDYQAYPVKRMKMNFAKGTLDFIYPDNPDWSHYATKPVTFSDPVVQYVDGLNMKPDHIGQPIHTLATIRGFTPVGYRNAIRDGRLKLTEHDSLRDLITVVLNDRADAAYAEHRVVQHYLTHILGQPQGLVFSKDYAFQADNYHFSSIKHPSIIERFDSWLDRHRDQIGALKKRFSLQ